MLLSISADGATYAAPYPKKKYKKTTLFSFEVTHQHVCKASAIFVCVIAVELPDMVGKKISINCKKSQNFQYLHYWIGLAALFGNVQVSVNGSKRTIPWRKVLLKNLVPFLIQWEIWKVEYGKFLLKYNQKSDQFETSFVPKTFHLVKPQQRRQNYF